MSESKKEMIARVQSMANPSGTWDLSENDIEALGFVVKTRAQLIEALNKVLPHAVAARYADHPDIVYAVSAIKETELD